MSIEGSEQISAGRKWLIIFTLSLGAGLIYQLPYLRFTYYDPLQKALGLDHTSFGNLMSVYGLVAMFMYWPGGWIADRFSSRKLLTFSLVATACGGFWLSTFPSYYICLLIHAIWGVTSILTFWSALVKVITRITSEEEQGKIFGFIEGGRGISDSLVAFSTIALFSWMGEKTSDFSIVINIYSVIIFLSGILCWFLLEDNASEIKSGDVIKDILVVLKMPAAWMMAGVIFCVYTGYAALSYTTPYMTEMFGLSVATAGVLGTVRTQILKAIGGPIGGMLSQKFGSATRVIRWGCIAMTFSLMAFLLMPANSSFLFLMIGNMMIFAGIIFALRGIYFSTIKEGKTPATLVGAVAGFISFVGYMPDSFIYTLIGHWLDKYPGGTGYQYMFMYMILFSVLGIFISTILIRYMKRNNGVYPVPSK
ncbi:MFS transporter [Escherichia albertii]|uniref:MFS transporter n=1 Tax=Escherichia albertii TaxID=208962 RepID=UPI0016904EE8|nr:MFS transporter [Escherichia albertii]MCE7713907.1 MFS transporter [Escherichia albertii]MCZ7514305.1 MFS transporter [Escherichia albertii]MCZ8863124.1 MFS transporter [Escherichia albertii]